MQAIEWSDGAKKLSCGAIGHTVRVNVYLFTRCRCSHLSVPCKECEDRYALDFRGDVTVKHRELEYRDGVLDLDPMQSRLLTQCEARAGLRGLFAIQRSTSITLCPDDTKGMFGVTGEMCQQAIIIGEEEWLEHPRDRPPVVTLVFHFCRGGVCKCPPL